MALACAVVVMSLVAAAPAGAAPFTVATTANDGDGSLREAITMANANAEPDEITITATGSINLNGADPATAALPALEGEIEIHGPDADELTVRRATNAPPIRIFNVAPGADVLLEGLSVRNGRIEDSDGGGGILNEGALELRRVAVRDNTLEFDASVAEAYGGGIYNYVGGALTIDRSTISGNVAHELDEDPARGGGIAHIGAALEIVNSTISGNTADGEGTAAPIGQGGGIYTTQPAALASSTVAENSATRGTQAGNGGNIFAGAAVTLQNTLIAAAAQGGNCDSQGGTFVSQGHNLEGANSCGLSGPGDLTNANPRLGPLKDNGGTTETHDLPDRSAAIDQGASDGLDRDQRGDDRPFDFLAVPNPAGGDGSDIGAFESQTPPTCRNREATIFAPSGGGELSGTDGDDVIRGSDDDDTIRSFGGKDLVCSREGADEVRGGDRRDKVSGGRGNDEIAGGRGGDRLSGNKGRDELRGRKGRDRLDGGPGKDRCRGGKGRDKFKSCKHRGKR